MLLAASPPGASERFLAQAHEYGRPEQGLSLVTHNLARVTDAQLVINEWRTHPAIGGADVFLLQEVMHPDGGGRSIAHDIAAKLGYYVASAPAIPGVSCDGLAIISRYPIAEFERIPLKRIDLGFRNRSRQAIAVTADTPYGRVRIFNTHLDTRMNLQSRLEQLSPVIEAARRFDGPKLIGGDLNTNHMWWWRSVVPIPFAHHQASGVDAAMRQNGFTTPFRKTGATFDLFGFQLDWIYVNGLETHAPRVAPMDFSDHHALQVVVRPSVGSVADLRGTDLHTGVGQNGGGNQQ